MIFCKSWGPYLSDASAGQDKMRRTQFKPVAALRGVHALNISDSLKTKLLQHFETEADVARASVASLQEVKGIGVKRAQRIFEAFNQASETSSTGSQQLQPSIDWVSQRTGATNGSGAGHPKRRLAKKSKDVMQEASYLRKLEEEYAKGKPCVPDSVYDSLKAQVIHKALAQDPTSPVASHLQSTVGAPVNQSSLLAKVQHTEEMGGRLKSLAAAHSAAEVRSWWERNIVPHFDPKSINNLEIVLEPKVDGLTMRGTYRNGKCIQMALTEAQTVQAATRGDGITGEDVTHTINSISGLPAQLRGVSGTDGDFSVRGEVHIKLKDFEALNATRTKQGMEPLSNVRNAAVGSLRHSDPSETARRKLSFAAFELIQQRSNGNRCTMQTDSMQWLTRRGIETLQPYSKLVKGIEQALIAGESLLQDRNKLPFQIDGFVLKLNDLQEYSRIGETATDPKWAVAWKPAPTEVATQVEDVVLSVGRSGVVVPVAILSPIEMGGVTVSRASLHNTHLPSTLDLHVGDTVVVERRGDVIPQVASVVKGNRPNTARPWVPPTNCPACNKPLKHRKSESHKTPILIMQCENDLCGGRKVRQLERFADIAITGVGKKVVQLLSNKGFVETSADFYRLSQHKKAIESLPRFGHKRVQNIFNAIEASRKTPASTLLLALGVPGIGSVTAELLLQHAGSIMGVANCPASELVQLPGISDVTAGRITAWFCNPDNHSVVAELASLWESESTPVQQSVAPVQQSVCIAGITLTPGDEIVATGSLVVPRKKIAEWCVPVDASGYLLLSVSQLTQVTLYRAKAKGLVIKSSVTKSTKLLIVGQTKEEAETSKQRAAKRHGTRTLSKDSEIQAFEHLIQQSE